MSSLAKHGPPSPRLAARRANRNVQLKPCCVEISKLSMRDGDVSALAGPLIKLTDQLYGLLSSQVAYDASVMDAKMAEYVFFPLSFIFKRKEAFPARLIENATKCLRLLIQHGWKAVISKDLAQQLLILLTFIIGGVPSQDTKPDVPEEYLLEGYRALTALIQAASAVPGPISPLVETAAIPAFGHCVTVILEGVIEGPTPEIQLKALDSIRAVYTAVRDQEALASFFPGTVSSLARLLSPPLSPKMQRRVLMAGLRVLAGVLAKVTGDLPLRNIRREAKAVEGAVSDPGKLLTSSWLEATAAQVKMALASVLKLRNHDSTDVRGAVERFCISVLDECHSSLSGCASILVESSIVASSTEAAKTAAADILRDIDASVGFQGFAAQTTLQDLATIYPELGDIIKAVVYNWIVSLARTMQTADEDVKRLAIQNLLKGTQLIRTLGIDSSTLEDALAVALRDSIVTLVLSSNAAKVSHEGGFDGSLSADSLTVAKEPHLARYPPILLAQEGQKRTREEMAAMIANFGSAGQQTKLAAEMLVHMRDTTGVDQLSAYWLSFELLKAAFSRTTELDGLVDLSSLADSPDDADLVFQELYSFSVSDLADHSDGSDTDWRREAIAMEVTAFAASRMRRSFRPELIDVLYPIATLLGSPVAQLQGHAVTTLNSIAASCGYGSVSELVIDNADYMVNSVSLKLNTLDISPASTQVLRMMIRLTGPRLIPFLDDVVNALFAALDNYHGYPVLVESLFSVLSEVVEQGVKSDNLVLEDAHSIRASRRKRPETTTTTGDILELLDKRSTARRMARDEAEIEEAVRARDHPKGPWASEASGLLNKAEGGSEDEEAGGKATPTTQEVDKRETAKTPTFAILARITSLTQHYLTSPGPALRKSLLDVLSTVAPALARDEDAFLPLVNTVWPVLLARLYDGEPYVTIAACKAVGALCAGAGDFLSSRIKTAWWDGLGKWCNTAKAAAKTRGGTQQRGTAGGLIRRIGPALLDKYSPATAASHGGGILLPLRNGDTGTVEGKTAGFGGLGRFGQPAQVWEAAAALLADIVSYVRLDDDVFGQVLDLLSDDLDNDKYRGPLEVINADAVWLALYKRGQVERRPAPVLDGVSFTQMGGGRG